MNQEEIKKIIPHRDNMLLVRQKGNDNVQRIPIREIKYIDYLNGEHENFNTN